MLEGGAGDAERGGGGMLEATVGMASLNPPKSLKSLRSSEIVF